MSLKVIKMGVNMCGVSSNTYINKGSVVYELDGEYITDPTRTSIQTDSTSHIEDEIGKYINHSCTPNVKVVKDKSKIKLIALKDILSNLEITFDYNSTEYKEMFNLKYEVVDILENDPGQDTSWGQAQANLQRFYFVIRNLK